VRPRRSRAAWRSSETALVWGTAITGPGRLPHVESGGAAPLGTHDWPAAGSPVLLNEWLIHIVGVERPAHCSRGPPRRFPEHHDRRCLSLFVLAPRPRRPSPDALTHLCAAGAAALSWGPELVKSDARRVAPRLFAPHMDSSHGQRQRPRTTLLAFPLKQNSGGASSWSARGRRAFYLGRDPVKYQKNKGAVWATLGVASCSPLGRCHQATASDQLQQAIWFYNRDLPR